MAKRIVIIGGGPAGYVAAIRAAMLGARVTVVEKNKLGGTCLNKGCIPTKALYKNAELLYSLNNSEEYGISIDKFDVNLIKIHQRKNDIVNKLISGVNRILESYNINIIYGVGSLVSRNMVEVALENKSKELLEADFIILAPGSAPVKPPIKGSDNKHVITSEEALEFENVPANMVIIGGGVIGMEFANIYNAFGAQVTVIEAERNILGRTDLAVVKRYQALAKKLGITIHTSARAEEIDADGEGLQVSVAGRKGRLRIFANKVLLSVGRKPVVNGLNLEGVGIDYSTKGIVVDRNYATNIKNIYAIGDVNGESMLAHVASHQGIVAVEHIMSGSIRPHNWAIPSCIFVSPEIATVGLTEEEAKEQGIEYLASRFLFAANGKALALGEDKGFIKVIADRHSKKVLGVHILGPHASDLIHEGVLTVQNKLNVAQIKQTIHAHPTLSETFYEAVLGLENEAIHKIKSK